MMPTDPEAPIYLFLCIALAAGLVVHMVISLRALKAAERADQRARILRSQLAIANRALEHWKMTDRQRWPGVGPHKLDSQATAAAGDRELESPVEAPATAVHSLELPAQHGTLPEHRCRIEDIRSAAADLIAETKETT